MTRSKLLVVHPSGQQGRQVTRLPVDATPLVLGGRGGMQCTPLPAREGTDAWHVPQLSPVGLASKIAQKKTTTKVKTTTKRKRPVEMMRNMASVTVKMDQLDSGLKSRRQALSKGGCILAWLNARATYLKFGIRSID